MSYQTFSLLVVVACFAALFTWVLWPSNRKRFERYGASILEEENSLASETSPSLDSLDLGNQDNKQERQQASRQETQRD